MEVFVMVAVAGRPPHPIAADTSIEATIIFVITAANNHFWSGKIAKN
jgi:hypothetical protein